MNTIRLSQDQIINVRIDSNTKRKADKILETVGLNTSQAIKLFLKKVIMRKGIPFDITAKEKLSHGDKTYS